MVEIPVLESLDFVKSPDEHKTCVQLKSTSGTLWIDVRKWFFRKHLKGWEAGKQGIMLELDDWKQVLPLIQALLNENSSK